MLDKEWFGRYTFNNLSISMLRRNHDAFRVGLIFEGGWLMRTRSGLLVVLAILISLGATRSAFAQAVATAQLNGTVTDPSGATVANAAITVRNTATNATSSTTSSAAGSYAFTNLEPGNYELKVSASGFANYTQTFVLTVGEFSTINVNMQLASQGEKVVVTTEAPLIEPTKTEISQVVGAEQVQTLPISNRVFTDFALLTPGVATSRTSLGTTFTEFETTQISFGGMRGFSNEITVDGADFVNSASGIQRATPPQASVEEFRVVNNSFGAEYGRAIGGIVNIVTKSGTNNLHGSLYEYFQNKAADARGYLQPAPLPDQFRENQFGVALGGPIKKDKTFFFVNYEGKRRAESPTYPPDLINNLTLIDDAKAVMGLAPEGCTTGLSSCSQSDQSYINGFLKTFNDDAGFARIDDQLNANNRIAIRYDVTDQRASGELVGQTLDGGGIGVPSGGRNLFVRDQSVVATWSDLITPSVANSFLAQYARRHYNFLGMTGQPDFSILNDLELGHNFGTNDRLYETRGEVSDSVSWVKGNHIAKFGFDANYLSSLENFPGFDPVRSLVPTAGPNPIDCLADFAVFYNGFVGGPTPPADVSAAAPECGVSSDNGVVFMYSGVPLPTGANVCGTAGACLPTVTAANAASLGVGPANGWSNAYPPSFFNRYSRIIDHGYWGLFAQDQWRITPKLTLNYGLRWDVESGLGAYVNQDYNGWQPRIGVAYAPDNKTVIRAGFGMFFDRQNLTFFFVPNTQKVVAGYQCDNNAPAGYITSAACTNPFGAPGTALLAQKFPNIMSNNSQATQGYQIFGFPAAAAPVPGGNLAAFQAALVVATGGYDGFENAPNQPNAGLIALSGACDTTGACGIGQGGMDHNSRTPYAEQASAEIDRELGHGLALNVSYLFVAGHKLVRGNNINIPCPMGTTDPTQVANPTDQGFWTVTAPAPAFHDWVPGMVKANGTFSSCPSGAPILAGAAGQGPALAGLGPWFLGAGPAAGLQTMSSGLEDYNNNVSNAKYHGGTVTFISRSKYFNMTANYTYSHTIDNGNFTTFINLPVNQLDFAAEEANSNQDVRHRFVANFTATAPTTGDWWRRNWLFSSIITLQSGRPFTLFYGANTLNDVAGGATDRVGGAGVPGTHCDTAATCQTMIPRNTYTGDPLYSWDFRIGHSFQLRENLKLELAVDAFNALNRANVDEVTSVYGSPVFCGAIPKHYRDATSLAIENGTGPGCPVGDGAVIPFAGSYSTTPITAAAGEDCNTLPLAPGSHCLFIPASPNADFGKPRTMLNPRQFQFSAKFDF
jgi:Carboxypeptidase regulatory-like domain/TonB dependent receptor-like, beta-barrel